MAKPSVRGIGPLIGVLLTMITSSVALAQNWIGTGNGNWSNLANWDTRTVPVSGTFAHINFNSASYVANNDLASPFRLGYFTVNKTTSPSAITGFPIEFMADSFQSSFVTIATQAPLEIRNDLIFNGPLNLKASSLFPVTLSGQLRGGGSLKFNSGPFLVTANNAYPGGTVVIGGDLSVTGAGNLGSGPLLVANNYPISPTNITSAAVHFDSAANVASPDSSITLSAGANFISFKNLDQAALNKISPSSFGVLGLVADSSAPLDFSNRPNMRLGTWFPGTTLLGNSVPPGVAVYSGVLKPGGNTYRFGGADRDTSGAPNPLTISDAWWLVLCSVTAHRCNLAASISPDTPAQTAQEKSASPIPRIPIPAAQSSSRTLTFILSPVASPPSPPFPSTLAPSPARRPWAPVISLCTASSSSKAQPEASATCPTTLSSNPAAL